jgi:hypothetical protein
MTSSNFFLVHRRRNADDVRPHDLGDLLIGVGDDEIAEARDAAQALLVDDVDRVHELVPVARALLDDLERLGNEHARRDRDEIRRHQVAGAGVRPLLDLADLLGGGGVDPLQRLEDLVAHCLGQHAEEVGPVVGRHLARDLGHRFGRHLIDELFLLVLFEALEDRRRVFGRDAS